MIIVEYGAHIMVASQDEDCILCCLRLLEFVEKLGKTGVEIFKGVLGGDSKKSESTTEVQTPLITQEGNNNKGFNESLNKNKGKISIG